MLSITKTFKRPSVDVPWHFDALKNEVDAFLVERTARYFDSILFTESNISTDKLSVTVEIIFTNKASYDRYVADPELRKFWNARDQYNVASNITATGPIITVI